MKEYEIIKLKNSITNIGKNVKAGRKAAGLSQIELAEKVNVTSNYISQIETSRKEPSLKTLASIAQALDVELKVLLDDNALYSEVRQLVDTFGMKDVLKELQEIVDSPVVN